MYEVTRTLTYMYPDEYTAHLDMVRWGVPVNGKVVWKNVAIQSQSIVPPGTFNDVKQSSVPADADADADAAM